MKKLYLTLSVTVTALAVFLLATSSIAQGAFNSSELMDDFTFNNTGTLNTTGINNFLNSFPSSCISPNNGFSAPDPTGYSTSGGFTYGGNVSAGQVINDAAQAYGINPE